MPDLASIYNLKVYPCNFETNDLAGSSRVSHMRYTDRDAAPDVHAVHYDIISILIAGVRCVVSQPILNGQ